MGIEFVEEIVAEILSYHSTLLEEVAIHHKIHRILLLKKIVFSFTYNQYNQGKAPVQKRQIEKNS